MTTSPQTPEYLYSEKPTLDQLQQMNWQYIQGCWKNPAITERETFKQVLLKNRLRKALRKFTDWLDENQIENAITTLDRLAGVHSLIETNQAIFDLLLTGIPAQTPDGRDEKIPYIDFKNPHNNDFLAICTFTTYLSNDNIISRLICLFSKNRAKCFMTYLSFVQKLPSIL